MSGRRPFLAGLAGALLAPRALAQAPAVVCYLALATRQADVAGVAAFNEGMRSLGHVEGRTYRLVELYADGQYSRADGLLRKQLETPVHVFLAPGPASARLVLGVTRTVPIVSVGLHPRGGQTDLFATLAQPGGMVTGVSSFGEELAAKRVQLLKEMMPQLASVGVLHNATDLVFQRWGEETEAELRSQGLATMRIGLTSPSLDALGQSLRSARAAGVQALVVVRDFLTSALYQPISKIGRDLKLATIAEERRYPDAGALMSYGVGDRDQFGRAAGYVDRILKGAKPAELPIEQPTRFEFVVNASTARTLGLHVPAALRLRADAVVE
ncbi:MAG: ABC transporter substrate-binding protein [Caldimonas sp.]